MSDYTHEMMVEDIKADFAEKLEKREFVACKLMINGLRNSGYTHEAQYLEEWFVKFMEENRETLNKEQKDATIERLHDNFIRAIESKDEEATEQVECDSCHELEDEDMAHPYGDATFCDSCYEGSIA